MENRRKKNPDLPTAFFGESPGGQETLFYLRMAQTSDRGPITLADYDLPCLETGRCDRLKQTTRNNGQVIGR